MAYLFEYLYIKIKEKKHFVVKLYLDKKVKRKITKQLFCLIK